MTSIKAFYSKTAKLKVEKSAQKTLRHSCNTIEVKLAIIFSHDRPFYE
jgi:hypothetical protein